MGIQNWPGAMAPYLCLPLENLVQVPDSVPDGAAVIAEPLAAALRIQQQVRIEPSHNVLVLGAGTLGQLVARTLSFRVDRFGVVARYPSQRHRLESNGIEWLTEELLLKMPH